MRRWISSVAVTGLFLLMAFFSSSFAMQGNSKFEKPSASPEVKKVSVSVKHKKKIIKQKSESYKQMPQKQLASVQKIAESEEINEESEQTDLPEENEQVEENSEQNPEQKTLEEAGVSDSKSSAEIKRYKDYVLTQIARKKKYPAYARTHRQAGRVKMKIVVSQTGEILENIILEESEFSLLNEASLNAVKKASPFKTMPAGMKSQTFVFAMDYSLE